MSKIKWVDVPRYETRYEISTAGEVRTKSRDIKDSQGTLVRTIESTLVPIRKTTQTPRPYVVLHDGCRYHKEDLENLLEETFKF